MFDIKNIAIGTLMMLKKFTIFNIPYYAEEEKEDIIFGIYTLPLIGLVIGLILGILCVFKLFSPAPLNGIIILLGYLILTKANSIFNASKFISIDLFPENDSKDFYAQLFTSITLFIYYALFSISKTQAIIIMPIIGFSGLIIYSSFSQGIGSQSIILENSSMSHTLFAFIFSFALTAIINYKLVVTLSLTYVFMMTLIYFSIKNRKIFSPHKESFLIELSQIIFLIISLLIN